MSNTDQSFGLRLALREEGPWWRAYIAEGDTMEKAIEIGAIHIVLIGESPELKEGFIKLMTEAAEYMFKEAVGAKVMSWSEPKPAPESERGGNA